SVDIAFSQNPGIGAMTFTLLYDSTTFSAVPNDKRYFYEVPDTSIKKYLIVDHPGDGYVSIVWAPEGNDNLYTGTGVAFRLSFRIDRQISGKHPFEIANIQPKTKGRDLTGCFSDFEHNTFTPKANNDAYVIGGDNNIPDSYPWNENKPKPEDPAPAGEHTHNFVLHKKVVPSCTLEGYSIYECSVCGEKVTKDTVPATGHKFTDYWTVDRVATGTVAMKLARHCQNCNVIRDVTYYTLDEVKKAGIKNALGTKVYESADNGLVKKEVAEGQGGEKPEMVDVDPESIKSAEELVESAVNTAKAEAESKTTTGKVKKAYSFFEKLYMYLIGTKSRPGILRIIIRAFIKLFGK
ncbi:MAG: hypothetical protein J5662_03070, partial [Clostridia bacterium]|nr:hypothetical protein [Clostridia bacterium]